MILLANDVPLLQAGRNTGYAEGCGGQGLKRLVVKLAKKHGGRPTRPRSAREDQEDEG